MFVDIADFKSALAVENLLTPYKKGRLSSDKKTHLPKEKITPDVCLEVLRSTNYARNIKDMLQCIAELPQAEQRAFKDVILAVFDNREQPKDILILAKKLAVASDYEAEMAKAKQLHEGGYFRSSSQLERDLVTYETQFIDEDFSKYPPFQKLICAALPNSDAEAALPQSFIFADMEKLPKEIEFSSQVLSVKFINCDVNDTKIPPLPNNCRCVFEKVRNLPKDLDVSQCSDVTFKECDLSSLDGAQFKNLPKVQFVYLTGVPQNLDVSHCDGVSLLSFDMAGVKALSFKDGANVCMLVLQNVPQGIDVSHCREFTWTGGTMQGFCNLIFDDNSVVHISDVKNLPEVVDVSRCQEVSLLHLDWSSVKHVVFKNKSQMKESGAQIPDNWSGNLEFSQDTNAFNRLWQKIGNKISR